MLAAALALNACASGSGGPGLDIREPPAGRLSPEQLAAVASDIRLLEAQPFARGAEEGRRKLMRWALVAPDVRLNLCTTLVQPLTDGDHPHKDAFLGQFMLSAIAHKIENPEADDAAMNVGGIEGVLAVYEAAGMDEPDAVEGAFLEEMIEEQKAGRLGAAVRSASAGC